MSKIGNKGAMKMTTVQYAVTPLPPADGNEIECDVVGNNVVDGAIRLPKGNGYIIQFALNDPTGTYQWAAQTPHSTPFTARNGKCPKAGKSANGSYRVTSASNSTLIVVEAPATPGNRDEVIHYRLNFANGHTCDPIIIRD